MVLYSHPYEKFKQDVSSLTLTKTLVDRFETVYHSKVKEGF